MGTKSSTSTHPACSSHFLNLNLTEDSRGESLSSDFGHGSAWSESQLIVLVASLGADHRDGVHNPVVVYDWAPLVLEKVDILVSWSQRRSNLGKGCMCHLLFGVSDLMVTV